MRIINQDNWPRKCAFQFFHQYETPQFNICADLVITDTYRLLQEAGIHKFTAFLWLVCKAANSVEEIRYRLSGDQVLSYEVVHPSFTWLKEDKTLTFCLAHYNDEISQFFANVRESVNQTEPDLVTADDQTPADVLYISCLPWINFRSISHPIKNDDSGAIPRITWGKFCQSGTDWNMPVSLQMHHGLADGYHAGLFFERLQEMLNHPNSINWQSVIPTD
ncbi:MAG: hypothetical protein D6B25_17375 [Desulfobulbaceae bacterium]|nr:MAG: hypothetical protein D6B25_17375 [Desulfobulbaceae bacterium]